MNSDSKMSPAHKLIRAGLLAAGRGNRRSLLLDFVIYNAVLACCTLIGLLFRSLGFSDATIISVYILGVLVSAVLCSRCTLMTRSTRSPSSLC